MIQIYSYAIRNTEIKKIKFAILSLTSMSSLIGNTFILIFGNLTPLAISQLVSRKDVSASFTVSEHDSDNQLQH